MFAIVRSPIIGNRRRSGISSILLSPIAALLDDSGYTYNRNCLGVALNKIHNTGNDLPQIYFQYLSDFVVNLGYGFDPDCLWESFRQIFPFAQTTLPQISGVFEVGNTLSCSTGVWSSDSTITYAYQWKINGAVIVGATNSTYELDYQSSNKLISCQVTATNTDGSTVVESPYVGIKALPTFYVRPTGSTYGTGDGSSYANAWSGFSNIVWASVENNILAICGTHFELLTVGISNCIIIGNDANEAGVIDGENLRTIGLSTNSRNNIIINSLEVSNHTNSNLYIIGTSSGIITNDCIFDNSGNQGIQHLDSASATHNNPTCRNCIDDGISLHDDTTVIINGGTLTGNDVGVNTIANSTTTINGPIDISGNISQQVWPTAALSPDSCLMTLNNVTISGLTKVNGDAKMVANNCNLDNVELAAGAQAATFEGNNSVIGFNLDGSNGNMILNDCLATNIVLAIQGYLELNRCRVTNDSTISNGHTVKARHTLFSGGDDMQLDFLSGSTIDIAYCVFYNMAASQFGVALRTGVNITNFHNCTFNGVSQVGRGLFAQEPNTTYNHIFTDLSIAAFQSTNAQTLENCCFFNNATDKSGTFTSNDEVTTNPLLVDAANLDFSLGAGSSCIGTGENLVDAEGIDTADWGNGTTTTPTVTTKVQGASWDIGAYIS